MTSLVERKGADRVDSDPRARAKTILPLPWSVVETMDILADAELMKAVEGVMTTYEQGGLYHGSQVMHRIQHMHDPHMSAYVRQGR